MTVKCLSHGQKTQIVHAYRMKSLNQKELAKHFAVSERTINRVLIEAGLATPVARIKGEAYNVMQLLKSYNMGLSELAAMLAKPALTEANIKTYLKTRTRDELASLFFEAMMEQVKQDSLLLEPEIRPIQTVNQIPLPMFNASMEINKHSYVSRHPTPT